MDPQNQGGRLLIDIDLMYPWMQMEGSNHSINHSNLCLIIYCDDGLGYPYYEDSKLFHHYLNKRESRQLYEVVNLLELFGILATSKQYQMELVADAFPLDLWNALSLRCINGLLHPFSPAISWPYHHPRRQ